MKILINAACLGAIVLSFFFVGNASNLVYDASGFFVLLAWTILVAFSTWLFLHSYVYDEKARIERLWREIHEIAAFKAKLGQVMNETLLSAWEKRIQARGKLINAILDYQDSVQGAPCEDLKDYRFKDGVREAKYRE